MDPHRLAELRSIALHRAVAERVRREPPLLARVRSRLERSPTTFYREEWLRALDAPLEELLAFLVEDSERARALRQSTPFTGIISPRERSQIWRMVRESA